jgi:drug/metabolite transporter (DMT)-like permease
MNRHTVSGRWKLGLLLASLTAFQFGAIPIVIKLLLKKVDPITLSWYRFTVAAIFLGLVSFRSHDLLAPIRLRGKPLLLLIVAVLGLSINYVLYTAGLGYSSPNTAQIIIQVAPMLLLLGGLLIYRESFSIRQGIGVAILLTGLLFFFDGKYDEILLGSGTLWLGILLVALSAAMWTRTETTPHRTLWPHPDVHDLHRRIPPLSRRSRSYVRCIVDGYRMVPAHAVGARHGIQLRLSGSRDD